MTTTVIVKAHCSNTKEVKIDIVGSEGHPDEKITLQNGEVHEFTVYDDRECFVREVIKE